MSTVTQDPHTMVVVPVVEHVGKQIGIAGGHPLKEVPPDHLAARRQTEGFEIPPGTLCDGWEVEDHSARLRVGLQDTSEQNAQAATYVDNEVVTAVVEV